jgi:hypothetical protein
MPTPATSKWPAPKSEDEWEDMVLDAMRLFWSDPNAQRNGRRGQRQFGVDIFGSVNALPVGAQAKNIDRASAVIILDEVGKASQFKPELAQYHIAIAGSRDAHIQQLQSRGLARRVLLDARPLFEKLPISLLDSERFHIEASTRVLHFSNRNPLHFANFRNLRLIAL